MAGYIKRAGFLVRIALTMLAVSCFGDAWATTYEWVDAQGNVNFTDDLSRVPPSYRDKVKVIELPESTGGAPSQAAKPAAGAVAPQEPDTRARAARAYEACQERLKKEKEHWTDELVKGRARLKELTRLIHRTVTARKRNEFQRERVAVKERIAQAERMLKERLPPMERECESIRYWGLEE